MKKHRILFGPINEALKHLADSPVTDFFAESEEAKADLNQYSQLTFKLRELLTITTKAEIERNLDAPFDEIELNVEQFCALFPSYPNFSKMKFLTFLLFAQKIEREAVPLDDKDIDENTFALIKFSESIEQDFYSYSNPKRFSDSLVVFSLRDYQALRAKVLPANPPELNVSLELLYNLLTQLGKQQTLDGKFYAMVKSEASSNPHAVLAFAKLNIVADGGKTHQPRKYNDKPLIAQREEFVSTLDYQQHVEVLEVLSEYNSRDELLTKYLTMYHVFENFMCKFPIVEIQTRPPAKQVSIRDFYALSKKLGSNEIELLERFFRKVFNEKIDGTDDFSKEVFDRWKTYVINVGATEVDNVLSTLNVKGDDGSGGPLKQSELKQENIARKFASIVYQLRNAIVHNKEVDLHITCASITNPMQRLISDVTIPSLERLCFHLIGAKNDHVWYNSRNFLLYK